MPQIGIVFHISMWWVAKNIKFDKNYEIKILQYINNHEIYKILKCWN